MLGKSSCKGAALDLSPLPRRAEPLLRMDLTHHPACKKVTSQCREAGDVQATMIRPGYLIRTPLLQQPPHKLAWPMVGTAAREEAGPTSPLIIIPSAHPLSHSLCRLGRLASSGFVFSRCGSRVYLYPKPQP